MKEAIGGVIIDALTPLARNLTNIVQNIDIEGKINRIIVAFQGLYALIVQGDFTRAFGQAFNVQEDSPIVNLLLTVRDAIKDFVDNYGTLILDFFKNFGIALIAIVPLLAIAGASVAILSNPLVQIALVIAALMTAWNLFKAALESGKWQSK